MAVVLGFMKFLGYSTDFLGRRLTPAVSGEDYECRQWIGLDWIGKKAAQAGAEITEVSKALAPL